MKKVARTRTRRPGGRFIVLTGLSGAGKSQAIRALEDLGYYCVDNLPTLLIPTLTSGAVAFMSPTGGGGTALWRNTAGAQYSAAPPGGITAMWLGSEGLAFLDGYHGIVQISATQQAANRDFVWYMKG